MQNRVKHNSGTQFAPHGTSSFSPRKILKGGETPLIVILNIITF